MSKDLVDQSNFDQLNQSGENLDYESTWISNKSKK